MAKGGAHADEADTFEHAPPGPVAEARGEPHGKQQSEDDRYVREVHRDCKPGNADEVHPRRKREPIEMQAEQIKRQDHHSGKGIGNRHAYDQRQARYHRKEQHHQGVGLEGFAINPVQKEEEVRRDRRLDERRCPKRGLETR